MRQETNEHLAKLLRGTARCDLKAFRSLYDETSPRLHAVALTMIRDASLAEDVLQDAFVQIWHRAGDYHAERGSVFTWMTTLVRYRSIDLLRKRKHDARTGRTRTISVDPDDIDYLELGVVGSESPSSPEGPLARALSDEDNVMLRDCIGRLSGEQQRSVSLAFFRGLTHHELAECLSEPLGTIKSRLRRSLSRLKDCLHGLGKEDDLRTSTH